MSTAGEMENEAEAAANPGGRCAACRYLRRRCDHDCVLAPYFPASQPHRYACVHRVFGASNVTRLLQNLPVQERAQAADVIAMEAAWRAEDPVYGCAGIIYRLQEEIRVVQAQLAQTRAQLAVIVHGAGAARALQAHPPPPQQDQQQTGVRMQGQDVHEELWVEPDEFLDLRGFSSLD